MNEVKLYKGDCLVAMKDIPDKSIDMILCDLPYGTTACKWDTIIPFDKLWEQYRRIVKDNGAIVLFCVQPFTSLLVASNIKHYKHHLIWLKNRGTGFQVAKYRPMMQTEDVIVFNNKGSMTYNPLMIKLDKPYYARNASSTNGTNPLHSFKEGGKMVYEKYPTNVLPFDKVVHPQHPTQKPVALLEYLIKTYSNEGDTILDNTMGSGSTGVACVNTKRNFIGIELNDEYFAIAEKRIKEAQSQLTLF